MILPPPDCSGLPGRTTLRPCSCCSRARTRSEWYCSGLPGRTTLRRQLWSDMFSGHDELFRSSRPDYIETCGATTCRSAPARNCSGLPGRTTLRLPSRNRTPTRLFTLFRSSRPDYIETMPWKYRDEPPITQLFRSSRPDYIETSPPASAGPCLGADCSGLPGRTTLRLDP